MPSKSKSFKASIDTENPAMRFISAPSGIAPATAVQETPADEKQKPIPNGFKVNPFYVETKSRRLQLLLQPSLYEKIKSLSTTRGVSVNELVHSLLEEAVR